MILHENLSQNNLSITYPLSGASIPKIDVEAVVASFPGSSAWAERKEPGTHCLRMLSSPRISGNLEISVKSAPLHQSPQGMPTSPV